MESISTALERFLHRKRLDRELQIAKVWAYWSDILGEELAKLARPLGRRKNTLIIGAVDNVVMQELVYYSPQILEQIDEFLGWQPFDKVVFELLDTRSSLDEIKIRHSYKRPDCCQNSQNVGKYWDEFPEDSAVAKSYRAFVQMFDKARE